MLILGPTASVVALHTVHFQPISLSMLTCLLVVHQRGESFTYYGIVLAKACVQSPTLPWYLISTKKKKGKSNAITISYLICHIIQRISRPTQLGKPRTLHHIQMRDQTTHQGNTCIIQCIQQFLYPCQRSQTNQHRIIQHSTNHRIQWTD